MDAEVFTRLGLALLLGLLVGLQRERTEPALAGIRTFTLIALLGAVASLLSIRFGDWVLAAGLIALAAFFVAGNLIRLRTGDVDPGLTTEVAGLLLYAVGAYLMIGSLAVGVAVGGVLAILLQWKKPLHAFVAAVGEADITAVMQFVLVTLVILPVLPNKAYGPYAVLNPFQIWLMVVLMVGISLAGYAGHKLWGLRAGSLLGGVFGGLVSSTATTATCARESRETPGRAPLTAAVVMIASAVVFVRVPILIAAVAPDQFPVLAYPLLAMLGVCAVLAAATWLMAREDAAAPPTQSNPAYLRPALLFGAVYAVVLLLVAFAKDRFGTAGVYSVAAISGLVDMDAITLSTARLVDEGRLAADQGWRAILLAAMSNLVFKAVLVALLGHRRLLARVAAVFALALVAGALLLQLWPG